VTHDTHVGLEFCGWLDSLVFILAFSLACSSTSGLVLQKKYGPVLDDKFPQDGTIAIFIVAVT
jgi:hypothetical protein